MGQFECEVRLEGSPGDVYRAITTPVGLRSWLTATCDVNETVGSCSTFRFGEAFKVMRLEELVPSRLVCWRCVEHFDPSRDSDVTDPAVDREGPSITFRIAPDARGGTLLRFEHQGPPGGPMAESETERRWDHFLRRSLKNYMKTAIGEPYGSRLAPRQMIA